jgi:hypothetical protein
MLRKKAVRPAHLERLEVKDEVAEGGQVEQRLNDGAEPTGLPNILQPNWPLHTKTFIF